MFGSLFFQLTAHAIESAGVGALPAQPRADNPRTQSIFVFESVPARQLSDSIKIINNSDETKTIRIYPVDSQHSSDGAFACAQEAEPKKEVGSWVTLAKKEVTLAPKTNEVVSFAINVPANAGPGEYNGCLAVQENAAPTQSSVNGIVLSFRSALRVAITVPGDIRANVHFNSIHHAIKDGKLHLSPVLKNEGNISVDAKVSTKLVDVLGMTALEKGGSFALLKNEESRFNFENEPPFWGGWYRKIGTAEYVPLREKAADQGAAKTAAIDAGWLFIAPHPLALTTEIALPLLIIGAIGWTLYRRRQHALLLTMTRPYTVKQADNLQVLAESVGLQWRVLARINKLKPPYSLTAGQQLLLPEKPLKGKRKTRR